MALAFFAYLTTPIMRKYYIQGGIHYEELF